MATSACRQAMPLILAAVIELVAINVSKMHLAKCQVTGMPHTFIKSLRPTGCVQGYDCRAEGLR